MNTRKYLKGLFLLATLFLAGCGDESESTPAAPDNSVENSGMAGTDSLDNTVFSCHDSNKQRVWNLTTVNRENPEIYAIELATYMAQETFYSILQDTVAQNHFESEEETYTEGTPSCLIDLIDEVSDFPVGCTKHMIQSHQKLYAAMVQSTPRTNTSFTQNG